MAVLERDHVQGPADQVGKGGANWIRRDLQSQAKGVCMVWQGSPGASEGPLSEQMSKLSEGILNEVVGVVPRVWGPREA